MPVTTISYGPEIRSEILARISRGEALTTICNSDEMPSPQTVYEWAESDEWAASFARARQTGIHAMVDSCSQIADDEAIDPASRKIRIETRRWIASKLLPNVYGDRTALQMLDEHGKPAKAGITIIVDGAPGE